MLGGMTLLHIALDHLDHQHVGVNLDALLQLVAGHAPLALEADGSSGRLGVNEGVDAVLAAGECERVSGLANGLLVRHLVDAWLVECGCAGYQLVGDVLWAGCLDVLVVVVQNGNNSLGGSTGWDAG